MPPSRRIALLPGPAGDRALVARLLAGEDQAYRDCYDLHAPRTLSLLVRMLRDRTKAEEILQETFVAVFKKVRQYRGEAQLGSWIGGIAIRRALNALRDESRGSRRSRGARRRARTRGRSRSSRAGISPGDCCGLLDKLPDDKRIAILLHAEGYTAAEIASMIKAPRATVLARIARGRAELVSLAAAAGISDDAGRRRGADPWLSARPSS